MLKLIDYKYTFHKHCGTCKYFHDIDEDYGFCKSPFLEKVIKSERTIFTSFPSVQLGYICKFYKKG